MNWQNFIHNNTHKIESVFGKEESISILKKTSAFITGRKYTDIRLELINPADQHKAEEIISALSEGQPLQYVTGEAWFYKYRFKVNPSVLIPRPETEELIEWMLYDINKSTQSNQSYRILDIGAGSGCIPICLKKERPQDIIVSIDISEEALELAKENAGDLKADIDFIKMNILAQNEWHLIGSFNFIISNPPYIPLKEKMAIDKQVINYEPHLALFVPNENPIIFYEKIADFGLTHLSEEGSVYVEIHQHFAKETQSVFVNRGYKKVEIRKDISGNERMLKASFY